MTVAIETAAGVYTVGADTGELLDFVPGASLEPADQPRVELPLLIAAAAEGSTVVALLDRRPPLAVSYDAGRTWREAGGGLPRGHAIAIAEGDPDRLVYASASRIFISRDGGRFWGALEPEFEEILRVGWIA